MFALRNGDLPACTSDPCPQARAIHVSCDPLLQVVQIGQRRGSELAMSCLICVIYNAYFCCFMKMSNESLAAISKILEIEERKENKKVLKL